MKLEDLGPVIFKHILPNMKQDVFVVDRDCRIVYANVKSLQELFPPDEIVGKTLYEVYGNLTPETSICRRVMDTGEPIRDKMHMHFDRYGRRRVAIINTLPIRHNGEIIGAFEIGEDITGINNLSGDLIHKQLLNKEKPVLPSEAGAAHAKRQYYSVEDIIGNSPAIVKLREDIATAAQSQSKLFIYGATGTGKEMVAQAVYSWRRAEKIPFVAYNCAAIPEALLESILFGTVKGSFTGAENKMGLFEYANGGVVFLDEINSMPLNLQAKVLRVLEEKVVRRVGAYEEIPVNFRLISSTNTEPGKMLATGMMREDLFYRLNVLYIEIPPLKERREDIPLLVEAFIEQINPVIGKNICGVHHDAITLLMQYEWPGNIRELRNCVERSMHLCNDSILLPQHIQFYNYQRHCLNQKSEVPSAESRTLKSAMADIEKQMLRQALKDCGGNQAQAARRLGLAPQTFNNKLAKYGLR